MRTLLEHNVFDQAKRRINYLYDEFDHVLVDYSGGKDSTVILELTVEVARARGQLPVEVLFIDQEAEWTSTVDIMRWIAARPELDVKWLQCPIQIFNATSGTDPWLWCWEEGGDWLRDKEPGSIHENAYGTTRFTKLFVAFVTHHYGDQTVAQITGVRAEESPARAVGLTTYAAYKHVTWGSIDDKRRGHIHFSPIYDWSYTDVWKAIHDNGWRYNELYDRMYQHGVAIRNMRVSSVHHETALRSLFYMHEVDIDLWNRLTDRLQGVNTAKHLEMDFMRPPKVLPPMFVDWREYRDYLVEHLIQDPEIQAKFRHRFVQNDGMFLPEINDELWKMHVASLLTNDYHGTKLTVFTATHARFLKGAGRYRDKLYGKS